MFDDKLALAWVAIFKALPNLYCFPHDKGSVATWRNVGWEAFRCLRSFQKWWALYARGREDLQSIQGRY